MNLLSLNLMLLVIESCGLHGYNFIQGFLGLLGLLTLLEQRVGQQLNICALAYKKVND